MTKTRTVRSPQEILDERLAQLEKAKIRAAKSQAKENPQLSVLQEMLNTTNKDVSRIARFLPKFDYRLESNRLHRMFILAEQEYTIAEEKIVEERRNYFRQQLTHFATLFANGQPITDEMIKDSVTKAPGESTLDELKQDMQAAHKEWRDYIKANKVTPETTDAANTLENAAKGLEANA